MIFYNIPSGIRIRDYTVKGCRANHYTMGTFLVTSLSNFLTRTLSILGCPCRSTRSLYHSSYHCQELFHNFLNFFLSFIEERNPCNISILINENNFAHFLCLCNKRTNCVLIECFSVERKSK